MFQIRRSVTQRTFKAFSKEIRTSTPLATPLTTSHRCISRWCMSPGRRITTSPEGRKRRKLNSSPISTTRQTASNKMSPLLVQEVDQEPPNAIEFTLTPVEATLRRLLLDVANYIDNIPPPQDGQIKLPPDLANEKIVLRFTGGWVRDKLLGVPSHDIDVAINKMTGYQFGLKMKEYLEIPGNPEKYGLEGVSKSDKAGTTDKSKTVGGLHKIEANPEKSKHLETVTTKILGLDIDLVNLRKETYTDESRNPAMEFGTPEEDALRRDATVNAMFYNLNTESVEDFTGRGKEDLKAQILRTPLEPYQTFKDDPLRVLRLIRFASRLGYRIDPAAMEAMKDNDIKDALRRKISRERVGVEMEKSLRGPDPHEALRLVFDLGLYETIFSDPTVIVDAHYTPDTEGWAKLMQFAADTLADGQSLEEILVRDDEERYLAWQLAALVPYRDAPQGEPLEAGRRAPPPIASSVAREGIKATNKVCDVVTAAVRNQSEISRLVDQLSQQKRRPDKKVEGEDASARDVLGMAVRRWGASWRSQAMYSLLVEVADDPAAVTTIERKYTLFVEHLKTLNILDAYTFKPLLDGKTLAKAINTPPGPWMKDALDVVMTYQLRNPDTANTDDAIAEVQLQRQHQNGAGDDSGTTGKRGELTSSLIHHFLKLTIRPLFIKAKLSAVTDAGRKNTTTVLPQKVTVKSMDDSINRPWKSGKDAYALDLLRWCVNALDGATVEQVWPLVVPPLLTLVDDREAKYKILGAELIGRLLEITPPSLIAKTGLGEVFEDALLPSLAYLPTITPEEESIPLLNATYPALLALINLRYPNSTPSQTAAPPTPSPDRTKHLDTVLRKGIIYGYTVCSQRPHIVSTLFTHLTPFLTEMGIDSVKHLKYLLPILTETLSYPLGDARVETLLSATRALQAVILNAWPRMVVHRGEVLKGLAFCWINIKESEGEGVEELRRELKEAVGMLRAAVGEEVDFEHDARTLLEAEPGLEGLLVAR
ncbi:hypothetical protein BDY17DRAFT_138728 [Neohortaea acidophila]|uniref:Poly A polymerase head domain-containing protein n=1 Tax=Neohortaea acidophila TaxID=245834 RepID=A0A6A6PS81_9PEZI|nr:uncharacterized protein BDY17DRAFT_138728 [Neohortaea acidophila]KAF2482960.1 hypothetical protein BDY17DRAFT_138728 [Neohortaea acidophila]